MRKIIIALAVSFIYSSSIVAQKYIENIQTPIIGMFNGLSLIDADTLRYYTTADFHLLEDGEVWNIDTLINRIMPRKNLNIKRINKFDFIRIEVAKKTAWISYFNTAEVTRDGKLQIRRWLESAVLIKSGGRWKIQMLHSTVLK